MTPFNQEPDQIIEPALKQQRIDQHYIAKETLKFSDHGPDSMVKRKLGKKYKKRLTEEEQKQIKILGENIFYQHAVFKILEYLPQRDILNVMQYLSKDMYYKFVPEYCAWSERLRTMPTLDSQNDTFVMLC